MVILHKVFVKQMASGPVEPEKVLGHVMVLVIEHRRYPTCIEIVDTFGNMFHGDKVQLSIGCELCNQTACQLCITDADC